ncbi:MAG: cytochrome c maturation protein CcmE [Turneriella sp.]|nr:cytochrome c maturation protein CcmE [Turneriella sp.]
MRLRLAVFFTFLAAALVILAVATSSSSAQRHLRVAEFSKELAAGKVDGLSRRLTLYGKVKEGSIRRSGVEASFILADGGFELPVEHSGKTLLPDTFTDGAETGVEGSYNAQRRVFISHKVMAKCASRYESAAQ